MSEPDYDDPDVEAQWFSFARKAIAEYQSGQGLSHGGVGDCPAWDILPVVSVWAIESKVSPGWVGWWVIYGDLPTDYVSAEEIKHPRVALREFSERWASYVASHRAGRDRDEVIIGDGSAELIDLLEPRSATLAAWANDDEMWEGY